MPDVTGLNELEAEGLLRPAEPSRRACLGDTRRGRRLLWRLGGGGLVLACAAAAIVGAGRSSGALGATRRPRTASAQDSVELQLEPAPPAPVLGHPTLTLAPRTGNPFDVFHGATQPAALPLPSSPFGADSTIGGGMKWQEFSTADEAFTFLDRDGDGVLTYDGDHIKRLKNVTVGVPKGVFEMYFNTEKMRLVSTQNLNVPMALGAMSRFKALAATQLPQAVKEEPRELRLFFGEEAKKQRLVYELYTYGAPGTAPMYVYDATRPMGCFQGLRSFSRGERYTVAFGAYFSISDPVAWITSGLNYDHAKMEAFEANEENDQENVIHPCDADYRRVVVSPQQDSFFWFSGHMIYEDVLKAHADVLDYAVESLQASPMQASTPPALRTKQEKVARASEMSHWAFMNYQLDTQLLDLDAKDHGYTLAARSCSGKDGFWAPRCNDHIALYQNDRTLECIFAFEGSDDVLDWVSDLDALVEDFCGFGHVHRGFKFKLMTMVKSIDYRQTVLPKLSSCGKVHVVGHSLGGAQAELFTACANKGVKEGEPGYEDYRWIKWEKGTPTRLPAFYSDQVKGGTFVRNKATDLCIDVRGTMETKYEEDVIAYPCELPSSNYSRDQHWMITKDGMVVNELSGYCMSAGVPAEDGTPSTILRQWPCGEGAGGADQHFEHTSEGFLKSKTTGKCVDSKMEMSQCPYTDQRWRLTGDGHLENVVSGLCLDVVGKPGTEDGAGLVIWQCEHFAGTDQLWSLSPDGLIRNTLSSKCVSYRNQQGRENAPYLVIASCDPGQVNPDMLWEHSPNGFLRSKKTGKCMNVEGSPGMANGTKVTLSTCEDKHLGATGLWVQMEGGFLRNVGNDYAAQHRCLEVFGAPGTDEKLRPGAKLHTTGCEINTDQRWEFTSEGYIRSTLGARKCLEAIPDDVHGALWLQNCKTPSDPNLFLDWKWQLTPDGLIKNTDSLECFSVDVDPADPSKVLGVEVQVSKCNASQADLAQHWLLTNDGFIQHRFSGACLDVKGNPGLASYTPLVLWHCERGSGYTPDATDQRWQFTGEGFLRNLMSSKCLQQEKGKPNLVPCPTEQKSQQWSMSPSGLIVNQHTGKCIDVTRNETAGSAPSWMLMSWDCSQVRPQQQWERVLA